MCYIRILNPRPKKFWDSPKFILKRVRRLQPTQEELTASLEKKRVQYGVPTSVDWWISVGLNSGSPHARSESVHGQMLADILEDFVECQLSTTQTKVSSLLCY